MVDAGAEDDAMQVDGDSDEPVFSWRCVDCNAVNGPRDGELPTLVCGSASCRAPSPGLRYCAGKGLRVQWVDDDNDCVLHATLDHEVHSGAKSFAMHSPDYQTEIQR